MECTICIEVCHPTRVSDYGVEGVAMMDIPNSWECPRCIKAIQDKKEHESVEVQGKEVKEEPNVRGKPLPLKIPTLVNPHQNDFLRNPISSR